MFIQHNMEASMANRCLDLNQKNLKVSSQRLASGYRINSAADDAAGLKISEKMRSQIRGLNRASDNLGEGIALCQVADGALQEVHAMLQRMVELSVQAGNDTNDAGDRFAIQQEIDELRSEINRISTDTEYNKLKIFKPTNVPQMEGKPNDIMIFHETGPDGKPRPGGIFYNGVRVPYSSMGLKFDSNENIVAGTYPVSFQAEDGNTTTIELIFDGGSRVPSGRQYTLIPDKEGIYIDNILHSWDSIKDENGKGLNPDKIQGGNYSFKHAGITFSFEVANGTDLDSLIEELQKDGLTTYELRSADWYTEEVKINPYISILDINIPPVEDHLIPGDKIDNITHYAMYADENELYLYIPADQSMTGQKQILTRLNWKDIGLSESSEWMSGGNSCVNPGAGWTGTTANPKPGGGWNITTGSNEGSHVTNGEQYRVYQYIDFNTGIKIGFTIDSEVSKQELIDAINSWKIVTETNNRMEVSVSKNDPKHPLKYVSHSSTLDAYGTQYDMGLCQEKLKRPFTLASKEPIVDGNQLSFTMTDAYNNPYKYTCSTSLDSIKSQAAGHLDSLIESYRRRIEYNLNNGLNPGSGMPGTSSTRYLSFISNPGGYNMTFSYQENLSGILNPNDTDLFQRVQDPDTKKWTVTFNTNKKNELVQKTEEIANEITDSLKNIEIDIKTNGEIKVDNSISSPLLTENIRYNTQVISGGREIKIQSSDNAWDHIKIELPGMNAAIIGVSDLDVSSYAAASASIEKIHKAIDIVSGMRSHFGALQNRMESAMAVDDIMAENTQAAESRIRDADMAKESLEFTKHNILKQAAESVLAQANHSKDGILSLLQ